MDEIGNPQGSEAGIAAAAPRRSTRAISLLVEKFGNLGIGEFVEELVDQLDDTWLRLHLLRRRLGVRCGERLGFATLEADVNLRGSFRRHLGESDILDDVRKQSFAFAVWRIRICPELVEVHCHRDEPFADSLIEDKLILLASAISIFPCFGQNAELLIPFAFERVSDEAIIGVDQHETALSEIRFDLGPFDRATAQPICFFIPSFDLPADLECQLNRGRRHLLGNQHTDGFVDGWPGNRLAVRLAAIAVGAITDVPGFQPSASGSVADAEMSTTSPAYCPSLQQRRTFSRRRCARHLISLTVGLENLEILLESLPADVAGMSIP